MDNTDPKSIAQASRVCKFLEKMSQEFPERWEIAEGVNLKRGLDPFPFGDLAYGAALMKWYQDGCPKKAWFSYAEEQEQDSFLMEFRVELTKEFGLPVLTIPEAKEQEKKFKNLIVQKVHDWGPN